MTSNTLSEFTDEVAHVVGLLLVALADGDDFLQIVSDVVEEFHSVVHFPLEIPE